MIWVITVAYSLWETAYFGWHWFPQSPPEILADGITAVLAAIACRRP